MSCTIAAFDLDGTLLKKNSSFAWCQFLCAQGVISYADFLFCSLTYARHCFFGLSFEKLHRLIFERLFLGRTVLSLHPYLESFLDQKLDRLWYQPALFKLQDFQKRGIECLILSNSPHFLVQAIAKQLGIQRVFATEYGCNHAGELTHLISLMDGMEKKKIMGQYDEKIIAFSDSHHDIPFLESAHIAVAVNPKRRLKHYARKKGWKII